MRVGEVEMEERGSASEGEQGRSAVITLDFPDEDSQSSSDL